MMRTRVGGHPVTITTTPTGFGPLLYVAQLDQPFTDRRFKGHPNDYLVAANLGQLLTGLQRITRQR